MTSPEARRDPVGGTDRVANMGDAGAVAVERLNAALYGLRIGTPPDRVMVDAMASAAAALVRIAGSPAPRQSHDDDTLRRNVAALAASVAHLQDDQTALEAHVAALHEAVGRLVARVDALEDRP